MTLQRTLSIAAMRNQADSESFKTLKHSDDQYRTAKLRNIISIPAFMVAVIMNLADPENPGDLAVSLKEAMANYEVQWQNNDESIDPDNKESHAISVAQMNESLGYVLAWLWAASQDTITRVAIEPITDSRSNIWCTNIHDLYITGVA